jgi:uncharacterized membrane protein YfhO
LVSGLNTQKQNYYLKALLYGMGISFLFFIPFIVFDNGYFLFYGDFNVQQVPFYQMCHDAVRNGSFGWSWTTDLGANFIGSYSFYLLGSPFFWLTLPFPSAAVPYLMGPLLILKFGCASLTGFLYLKRYVKNPDIAIIGGMLYAFSGFSIYNIFFNHFHEAIVFFPLLLWAMDEYMYKRRRGIFALTVFISCTVNYYFFVGQVVFCLIYGFTRLLCGNWKISVRDFLLFLCECVIGVMLSCFLLVPTILAVIQNPRVSSPPEGWNALLYDWNQRYVHILQSLFFPPDIPARPNFTPKSEAKWASLGAWLPLFSMTGVIGFMRMRKKHWLKNVLFILFLMAFVPVLNSAFQLFNSSYYARWFYMLTLMMALATIISVEQECVDWKSAIKWTTGITLGIALPIGLMVKSTGQDNDKTYSFGLEDYPTRFWSYVAIALLSLTLLTIIFKYYKRDKKKFIRLCISGISVITVVYAAFFIALGKTQSDDTHKQLIPYSLNGGRDIHLEGKEFSRIDVYDGMDNQAMYWQMPTIQAFHSIVPGSVMDFYPSIGVQRDVGSRPDVKYYGLRGLTSTRWLFDPIDSGKNFAGDTAGEVNKMPGWSFYAEQNGFKIYRNDYFIPMGFSYDSYITKSEYELVGKESRNLLLLKSLVIEDEDTSKYAGILTHNNEYASSEYTYDEYYQDCLDRKAMTCSDFTRDNGGFNAKITTNKERFVFFSVPWEGGWSASVNGKQAEVLKANIGFMAVKVPLGTSSIRFDYKTPGLQVGALASLGGLFLMVVYYFMTRSYDKRISQKRRTFKVKQIQLQNESADSTQEEQR